MATIEEQLSSLKVQRNGLLAIAIVLAIGVAAISLVAVKGAKSLSHHDVKIIKDVGNVWKQQVTNISTCRNTFVHDYNAMNARQQQENDEAKRRGLLGSIVHAGDTDAQTRQDLSELDRIVRVENDCLKSALTSP